MNWLIEFLAKYLYNKEFSKFNKFTISPMFTWEREKEDVKESWRKHARNCLFFWRRP